MKSTDTWCTFVGYMPIPKSCWRCAQRAYHFFRNIDSICLGKWWQWGSKTSAGWLLEQLQRFTAMDVTHNHRQSQNLHKHRQMTGFDISAWIEKAWIEPLMHFCSLEKGAFVFILEDASTTTSELKKRRCWSLVLMLSMLSTADIVLSQQNGCTLVWILSGFACAWLCWLKQVIDLAAKRLTKSFLKECCVTFGKKT